MFKPVGHFFGKFDVYRDLFNFNFFRLFNLTYDMVQKGQLSLQNKFFEQPRVLSGRKQVS